MNERFDNMSKYKFIQTFDEDTKFELIRKGYQLVDESGGRYVFIDKGTIKFDNNPKVKYTNKLNM